MLATRSDLALEGDHMTNKRRGDLELRFLLESGFRVDKVSDIEDGEEACHEEPGVGIGEESTGAESTKSL